MERKVRCTLIRIQITRYSVSSPVEIATLTRHTTEDKTVIKVLPGSEVDSLIDAYYKEEERKKEEKEAHGEIETEHPGYPGYPGYLGSEDTFVA